MIILNNISYEPIRILKGYFQFDINNPYGKKAGVRWGGDVPFGNVRRVQHVLNKKAIKCSPVEPHHCAPSFLKPGRWTRYFQMIQSMHSLSPLEQQLNLATATKNGKQLSCESCSSDLSIAEINLSSEVHVLKDKCLFHSWHSPNWSCD